ncbi:MAG: hypothetical protein ACTSQI_14205 [Candidatus Helarchaeota archaeon]
MPREQINLDAYIPFYEVYKSIDLEGGALRVYLRGDREINTDVIKEAIIGNLLSFRLDPDEILSTVSKKRKRRSLRLKVVPEPIINPFTSELRPSLRWVIVRMPEAGFTLIFSRRAAQVVLYAGSRIPDPFPVFIRYYIKQIEYSKVLKVLAGEDLSVRKWVIYHWKKIKEIDRIRRFRDHYYARRRI